MSRFICHPRSIRRAIALASLVWLTLSAVSSPSSFGQEQPLGSTATLEQIQKGWRDQPAPATVPSVPRESDLVTEPAAAPALRLEYRFWPNEVSLKPGKGLIHLDRALIFYRSLSQADLQAWSEYQEALGDNNPEPVDLAKRLKQFEQVYLELDRFAECEDQSWDLRLRDLRGTDVFAFLLPEVQQYRELARLLRFRALEQLGRRDFTGAVASIRCGYRLASFVRQGETLIQQLVGIAIEGIMQGTVEDAIRTPGCPNLYFALATVPHERRSLFRALDFELSGVERVFPVLSNPETQVWSREVWAQKWVEAGEELATLVEMGGVTDSIRGGKMALGLILAAEVGSDARSTRKLLINSGLNPEKVAELYPEQVVAVAISRQLGKWRDELLAACLLPYPAARAAAQAINSRMTQDFDLPASRNIGAVFGQMLFPAVTAAIDAELRVQSMHNRLMTIEAVRHYAATHDGKLPQSLAELSELPPQVDLHTGQLVNYEVKSGAEGPWAEFSLQTRINAEQLKLRRMRFRR